LFASGGQGVTLVCVPEVIAYIDPGSGSILLQVIIAGFLGVVAFFRGGIAALFRRGKKGNSEDNPSSPQDS